VIHTKMERIHSYMGVSFVVVLSFLGLTVKLSMCLLYVHYTLQHCTYVQSLALCFSAQLNCIHWSSLTLKKSNYYFFVGDKDFVDLCTHLAIMPLECLLISWLSLPLAPYTLS
jgi:SNF family Na+-dependent transporter